MYESHFGLTAPPFNLNPDPSFYFQSKGHGNALSYLRFGVYQGEGFVVVTGEIGAGKTTLVRTLLSELDERTIVAAQIVSTQLEAGDLLKSVALAFGLAPKNLSKAELIASIEAFLTLLVTQNKRALLIVDEAQNLNLQAIEELRMLSNFQLGKHALLQSFLVGQPELRELLTSKPMEQFRQRVIASCHLGPMDATETRSYIEHRLRCVGWTERPAIADEAFEQIHARSGGIPRRVNLLCNRLLLSAFLANDERIEAAQVETVADEANTEVGRSKRPAASVSATVAPSSPLRGNTSASRPLAPWAGVPARTDGTGPMLCVAASRNDDVRMAILLRALQARQALPPLILVRIGDVAEFELNDAFHQQIGLEVPTVELTVAAKSPAADIAEVMSQFEALVELHRPGAVVVVGDSDAILACGLVANKSGSPLAHVDAGRRESSAHAGLQMNRVLLDRLAQVHCVADGPAYDALVAEGASPDGVLLAGNLLGEAATAAAGNAIPPAEVLAQIDADQRRQFDQHGYCLFVVGAMAGTNERRYLTEMLSMLRKVSAELPIVWPMPASLSARLDAFGLRKMLRGERIAVLPPQAYAQSIALLSGANCVLTDSREVQVEAEALAVPSLFIEAGDDGTPALDHGIKMLKGMGSAAVRAAGSLQTATVPDRSRPRGGAASEQIAAHLERWMAAGQQLGAPAP
jgi:UDP-N-acetylglucosamine 2-epimerase